MSRYRKLPVEVDAMQFDGTLDCAAAVLGWYGLLPAPIEVLHVPDPGSRQCVLRIKTLEGQMTAGRGDWLIRGVAGELYPCKPDIFAATYEAVEP